MSHAFRSQTPSPRSAILSKTESSCQEQTSKLRLARAEDAPDAPDVAVPCAARAPIPTRRYRFTDRVRTQRAARLCILAAELPPDERALVLSRYADGRSSSQIAALAGCSRFLIERKLRRLTTRLSRPEYIFLAPRLIQLDPAQRSIARACFIEGRSIRAAAIHLNISQHALRESRAVLLALVRGLAAPGTPPVPGGLASGMSPKSGGLADMRKKNPSVTGGVPSAS